jgi:pimeloyl-ACP methyl ester carboxylesterase
MPDHGVSIVLVHGAFANTSSWAKVIPLLKAKGLSVVAVHCPLSSLVDDVASVDRVIGMQDAPVLLVGHSWGGAIITEAGNSAKVSGLVYIAVAAPDSAESFNEWQKGSPPGPGAPEIKPYGPGGYVAFRAEGFRDHFGQDLPADEVALLHANLGPFAQDSNDEAIGTAAWRAKPTWFIIEENDHMLLWGAKTLMLRSSHLPMLSSRTRKGHRAEAQPYAVADFIQEAANLLSATN